MLCEFDSIWRELFPCFIRAWLTSCTEGARALLAPASVSFWKAGGAEGLGQGWGESHPALPFPLPSRDCSKPGRLHAVHLESTENSLGRFCWIKMGNLLVALFQNLQNLCLNLCSYLEQRKEKLISASPRASQDPLESTSSATQVLLANGTDSAPSSMCQRLNKHIHLNVNLPHISCFFIFS